MQFEFLHLPGPSPSFLDQNSDCYKGVEKLQIAIFWYQWKVFVRRKTHSKWSNRKTNRRFVFSRSNYPHIHPFNDFFVWGWEILIFVIFYFFQKLIFSWKIKFFKFEQNVSWNSLDGGSSTCWTQIRDYFFYLTTLNESFASQKPFIDTRKSRSATFRPPCSSLSFDPRRMAMVQEDAETQIASFKRE